MLEAFLERLVERLLELPAKEPGDQAGVAEVNKAISVALAGQAAVAG